MSGCAHRMQALPERGNWICIGGTAVEHPGRCSTEDQEKEDVRVADVRLHQECADAQCPWDERPVADREAEHHQEEEHERQDQRVGLPDIDQQLAAHRPREGRSHDEHHPLEAPPADAPRDHRDADDAADVDRRDADGCSRTGR
jgi:hypothetical protein